MNAQDRRRFFRIDDRLQLALHRFADDVTAGVTEQRSETMIAIDRRLRVLIDSARLQAPAVAELAELLNRKLEHVLDTLRLHEELAQRAAFREHEVNLSACGMALATSEHYDSGARLAAELLLPPAATPLRLLARVVRCAPKDGGGYRLLLDFAGIREEDQEQLIQYIVRRQSQFLQQLREQRETRPTAKPR